MNECPKKKCLTSAVAVFVFILLYEHFFHTCPWMQDMYHKTASLWRTPDEMKPLLPWLLGRHALLALAITCLYGKLMKAKMAMAASCPTTGEGEKKCCPYKMGMCFGLQIGVIMGAVQLCAYVTMPIPMELVIAWFFGSVIQGLGIGIVLALVCKKSECTTTPK